MFTYDTCFAYHHAGAMVNSEVFSYSGTGINIYAGERVSELGEYAGEKRNAKFNHLVGKTVMNHGLYHRVT